MNQPTSEIGRLLIQEPPLQVLPSLACSIGLNEAIVLQQLWYLLRDPRNGKRIEEKQWIFNTYEQWRVDYFPFWCERTIRSVFSSLAKAGLIECCQPEGTFSRRKYYRINEAQIFHLANLAASKRQNLSLPLTKTSSSKMSKESKETAFVKAVNEENFDGEEFQARWKPNPLTKAQQLKRIRRPSNYPSQVEFEEFISQSDFGAIDEYRPDLYSSLCDHKWHHWSELHNKWERIRDWRRYVEGLNARIDPSR